MQNRTALIIFLLVVSVILCTAASASTAQWAVTASYDTIYLVKHEGNSVTSYQAAKLTGSFMTGIGSYGGYIFVADTITDNGKTLGALRVGKISDPVVNPTIEWVGEPIKLFESGEILKQPRAITVDSSGGVYIIGGRYQDAYGQQHSNYAYVKSTNQWASAQVSVVNMPTTALADIAPIGSGAVVAHRDLMDGIVDQTWVSKLNGASVAYGQHLDDGGYLPSGVVAGNNGLIYVSNRSTEVEQGDGPVNSGSISVINASTLASVSPAFDLDDFRPTDIAFFTIGGVNYLGLVGTDEGLGQALRVKLGEDGLPLLDEILYKGLDVSTDHYCTMSGDGRILWATNPQSNTVSAFDVGTWTAQATEIGGAGAYISALTFAPIAGVPEPSAVLALFTGIVGLFGVGRMRRSARF